MKRVTPLVTLCSLLCLASAAAAQSGAAWGVYGGDAANTRYSTLGKINTGNVQQLRVAWALQLGSVRSQESSPILVGDTLYVTSSFGPKNVFAVDAKTGTVRWRYSPDVPGGIDQFACCDVNNRGVAHANGKIFVGRLDGHMVALDAKTGQELWKTQVVDFTQGSVITSPPTIVKNLVITGFGGGEYGARGYISALDQDTGKEVWRFWTAPGPGEPDSGNYGNFTNLYSSSTLALNPDTGKLVWHYQSTPHDVWDYDGVNELVLADVSINGQMTPVMFKADRNGFFYVLNRKTGQLISAKDYVPINWATGVDMATGRPIEVADKRPRFKFRAMNICPNLLGGKNWHPMSYNPQTGLVYIPSINLCMDMEGAEPAYKRGSFYLAFEFDLGKGGPGGYMSELMAWDPVKQQKVWGNKDALPWLGGTMTTAGGLVFHGDVRGWFKALDAKTGKLLWQFNTGSGISAAPVTYELDGKQYVAVVSGRTFSIPVFLGPIGKQMVDASPEGGTLFVFELPSP